MDTWQVSYERQLTNTLMAEVAYVGSRGSNLIWVGNINEVQPGPGTQASRRLIQPLSNVVTINYFDPTNRSSFNGLQVKLNQRFSGGLQFLTAYTFGKSLDYAGSPGIRRRSGGRSAERDAVRGEPRPLGLRREAPLRAELGLGAALRDRTTVSRTAGSASRSSRTGS